eukprot:618140-Prymnesium_polylepis.1
MALLPARPSVAWTALWPAGARATPRLRLQSSDWAQMEYLDREHPFSAVLSTATASHDAGRTKRTAA